MLEEEILDDIFAGKTVGKYQGAITWWESRRWKYNKIVGLTGVVSFLIMIIIAKDLLSADGIGVFIGFGIFFLLFYNTLYTFMWGLEMAILYFFKKEISESVRNILYWGGTILSLLPFFVLVLAAAELGNNLF